MSSDTATPSQTSIPDRDRPWLVERRVSTDVAADPGHVYDLVSDVTRIGEWSPECHAAAWLDERRSVGARFRGQNRWGANRWARICEVTADEPGRRFAYRTVPGRRHGPSSDSSVWGFEIEPTPSGCRLTQFVLPTHPPARWFRPFIRRFMGHHLDMRDHMTATIAAIRSTAEAQTA